MMKSYNLDFEGYWQDKAKSSLPEVAGIYVVYKGTLTEKDTVSLDKIVYIGEAEDINARHNDQEHEHYRDFVRECGGADHVWYSCAAVSGGETERKRVEAALIFELQPKINTSDKDSFNYPTTVVNSTGRHEYIPDCIVV